MKRIAACFIVVVIAVFILSLLTSQPPAEAEAAGEPKAKKEFVLDIFSAKQVCIDVIDVEDHDCTLTITFKDILPNGTVVQICDFVDHRDAPGQYASGGGMSTIYHEWQGQYALFQVMVSLPSTKDYWYKGILREGDVYDMAGQAVCSDRF